MRCMVITSESKIRLGMTLRVSASHRIKCRLAAHKKTLSSLLPSNQTGIFLGFHMQLFQESIVLAHVANKGADCVQNNTAPQPIFKENEFFHFFKTAG